MSIEVYEMLTTNIENIFKNKHCVNEENIKIQPHYPTKIGG